MRSILRYWFLSTLPLMTKSEKFIYREQNIEPCEKKANNMMLAPYCLSRPSIKWPEWGYLRACFLSISRLNKSAISQNAAGLSFSKANYLYQLQTCLPTHLRAVIEPAPRHVNHYGEQGGVSNRQNKRPWKLILERDSRVEFSKLWPYMLSNCLKAAATVCFRWITVYKRHAMSRQSIPQKSSSTRPSAEFRNAIFHLRKRNGHE